MSKQPGPAQTAVFASADLTNHAASFLSQEEQINLRQSNRALRSHIPLKTKFLDLPNLRAFIAENFSADAAVEPSAKRRKVEAAASSSQQMLRPLTATNWAELNISHKLETIEELCEIFALINQLQLPTTLKLESNILKEGMDSVQLYEKKSPTGRAIMDVVLGTLQKNLPLLPIAKLKLEKFDDALLPCISEVLPQMQNLTALNLHDNQISDLTSLAAVLPRTKIESLTLSYNSIRASGLEAFAAILSQTKLLLLDLSSNFLEIPGTQILAAALPKSHIEALYLNNNKLGNEGLAALVEVLSKTKITELELSDNAFLINSDAVRLLTAISANPEIFHLNLSRNQMSDEALAIFAQTLPNSGLQSLNLYHIPAVSSPPPNRPDIIYILERRPIPAPIPATNGMSQLFAALQHPACEIVEIKTDKSCQDKCDAAIANRQPAELSASAAASEAPSSSMSASSSSSPLQSAAAARSGP